MIFSGHESFTCRQFWLKKGYDFVCKGNKFNDPEAVVHLGIGKNMVSAVRFWLRSFELIDMTDTPTILADFIFGDKGVDNYIEDSTTIWLLHYFLIKTNHASIYSLFTNEFRKERIEFDRDLLLNFIERKCKATGKEFSYKTLSSDINVLLRNYIKPSKVSSDIENDYSNLLIEINYITQKKFQSNGNYLEYYKINIGDKTEIPSELILFAILDNDKFGSVISFRELQVESNSPALIFGLNSDGLYEHLKRITDNNKNVILSDTAGVVTISIKKELDKWNILKSYYENQ